MDLIEYDEGVPVAGSTDKYNPAPYLQEFPLENIDKMRMNILADVKKETAFTISAEDPNGLSPYVDSLGKDGTDETLYNVTQPQEGLGIKTYQSDLFNNWISTEWIDGDNGINAITAVDTSSGEFTIDALNLAHKVYNMLNRIAISGGTYDDWLTASWGTDRRRGIETPVYHGSLIKELGFEEVVSTAESTAADGTPKPQGNLAGRGAMTGKHKGGKVKIKCYEHSVIMGIVSITPRIDYRS